MTLRRVGLIAIAAMAACLAVPVLAQSTRIRGEITRVDGDKLTIKSRGGAEIALRLAGDARIASVTKASLADIKPDTYVGCAALPQADGTLRALEVHIFPATMRGVGDGSRPFDLEPGSTMTNGAITGSAAAASGSTFTITYGGGAKTVVVTPETPIVLLGTGARDDLKTGAGVVVFNAAPAADGVLEAKSVTVGRNGVNPPM
jgi:hypothetical protein